KMPSWFGTGSEDYFGFSWGTPGYFSKAYHTQALAPPGTLYAPGNRALNRFQITDNVPFQTAFEGCIEKWFYTNDTIGAFDFYTVLQKMAGMKGLYQFRHRQLPSFRIPPRRFCAGHRGARSA